MTILAILPWLAVFAVLMVLLLIYDHGDTGAVRGFGILCIEFADRRDARRAVVRALHEERIRKLVAEPAEVREMDLERTA
jgi:hypothetical protein